MPSTLYCPEGPAARECGRSWRAPAGRDRPGRTAAAIEANPGAGSGRRLRAVGELGGSSLHWNGTAWLPVALPPAFARSGHLSGILARSDKSVWIGGGTPNSKKGLTETAAHWNGTAWAVSVLPAVAAKGKFQLASLVSDSHGGLRGLGSDLGSGDGWRLWHLSGGAWSSPIRPKFSSHQVIMTGLGGVPRSTSVWVSGIMRHGSGAEGLNSAAGGVSAETPPAADGSA